MRLKDSSLGDAYQGRFGHYFDDGQQILPICEFAKVWLDTNLTMFQRVILKLFAGESLSDEPVEPYDVSEEEWLELMVSRDRFPRDVYARIEERGSLGFENINLVVGRRGGKTTLIAIAVLYSVYKLLQKPNPQKYYGIQESENIIIAVAANSGQQATEAPFAKISAACKEAKASDSPLARFIHPDGLQTETIYFQTEHDKDLEASGNFGRNTRISSVQIKSYNTNQSTQRGGSVIVSVYDEFGWFPVTEIEDKGATFYSMLTASQHQFKEDARAFTLSSPGFQFGQFYDMYVSAWGGGLSKTVSVKMPSWEAWEFEPNPIVTKKSLADDDKVTDFEWRYREGETWEEAYEKAPSSFKREYGAEFEGAEAQWLQPFHVNRFLDDGLPFRTFGIGGQNYIAHGDPAYADDAFAFVVGHREGEKVVIDHAWRWFVAPNHKYIPQEYETVYFQEGAEPAVVQIEDVKEHFREVLKKFNIYKFTFDQRDSEFLVQELGMWCVKNRIKTAVTRVDQNPRYNRETSDLFRRLLYEDRIKSFENPLMRTELLGLQKDRVGRVQKGPATKDDLYDCLRNVAYRALNSPEHMGGTRMHQNYKVIPRMPKARV